MDYACSGVPLMNLNLITIAKTTICDFKKVDVRGTHYNSTSKRKRH